MFTLLTSLVERALSGARGTSLRFIESTGTVANYMAGADLKRI